MRDKVKRNFVCVKIIKIKNIPKKEREATRIEVDLLKRLHHPNIVRYIDSFLSKNNESLCICMEYCDGVSKYKNIFKIGGMFLLLCFIITVTVRRCISELIIYHELLYLLANSFIYTKNILN